MKLRNKLFKPKMAGLFLGLTLSSLLMVQSSDAVDFTPLDIVGKGSININYTVDDTKGITNYAGVSKVQACLDCRDKLNLSYTMSTNGRAVTNASGTALSRVNDGDLTYLNFEIPEDTTDGKHWVCIQTEDDTAKTINGIFQKGNVSTAKDNVTCKRFYYDTTAPEITDIILNNNNRYTNKSEIPVKFTVTDNYAGIREITYNNGNGGTSKIPASDISCKRNTTAGATEGKWTCTVDTIINVNSDRADADIVFTVEDKVGNIGHSNSTNIRFDKLAPEGTVEIHEDGEGVVNSNVGYVEYHVKDPTGNPWIYPSGLTKVIVSEVGDPSNGKTLLDDPDLTKDKQTSLDGMITDFLLSTCDSGAVSVNLQLWDRAGNTKTDIISNSVVCSQAKISRFDVTDVINPALYTESIPFSTLSWVFNDGAGEEGMEDGILAPLLAGANASFEFDVEWTGDVKATSTATYIVHVKNESQGYEKSFSGALTGTPFIIDSNGKKYSTFKDTVTLPKDASTSGHLDTLEYVDSTDTEVTIEVVVTITSVEGGKNKVNKATALFQKNGNEARWGKIIGNIDDYLWFGETN